MIEKKHTFRLMANFCVFCLLLNMTLVTVSYSKQYSDTFKRFLREVERTYILPKRSWNLERLEEHFPDKVAAIIGYALRQQELKIPRRSPLMKEFKQLRLEAHHYLWELELRSNPYDKNAGRRLTNLADAYQSPTADYSVLRRFGVPLVEMPSVFDNDSMNASGIIFEDEEEEQIFIATDEETGQIMLLEEMPVELEDVSMAEIMFDSGVAVWERAKAASKRNDYEAALNLREDAQYYFDEACELGYPDACGYMEQDDIQNVMRSRKREN